MSADADSLFALGLPPEDYDLPHPKIELPIILIVRRALVEAFARLRERCRLTGRDLAATKENDVTRALLGVLENDLRQKGTVAGFNKTFFEEVTRQREVENYSFIKTEKKPDMVFKLRSDEEAAQVLSTQNALFVECKPVDSNHPAGGDYCDAGLRRFVEGDYAWAMQDALMIGYVRDGRIIAGHLVPALQQRPKLETLSLPKPVDASSAAADSATEALHTSSHRRPFPWPGGKGPACTITIYHSWHLC
jgi:hypothetical protein